MPHSLNNVVQDGRSMFGASSEIPGNSVLISSQNPLYDFFLKIKVNPATQTAIFKNQTF